MRDVPMIFAIDPGQKQSAWCAYDTTRSPPSISAGILPNDEMREFVGKFSDTTLILEMVACYGLPVGAEVFDTCVWIGRFIEAHGGPFRLVYRKDVKMHLCGTMRAKDSSIRQRLIDLIGPPGTKKNPGRTYGLSRDQWQALAVAVTAAETGAS